MTELLLELPHSAVAWALGGFMLLTWLLIFLAWQLRRHQRKAWAVFSLLAALGVLFMGVEAASPKSALFGPFLGRGSKTAGLVALTFDDGPDPAYTPEVLEILARHQVKATFFMLGEQVQLYPELARSVSAEGHVFGSHGFHHVSLMTASPRRIGLEISLAEKALAVAIGEKPYLFRPPYGFHPPFLLEEAQRRGLLVVGWSISPHDSFGLSGEKLARRVIARAHSGDIILLHDGRGDRQGTVEALPLILEGLEAKGLKCVTIPELLSAQSSSPSYAASVKADKISDHFVKLPDNSRP